VEREALLPQSQAMFESGLVLSRLRIGKGEVGVGPFHFSFVHTGVISRQELEGSRDGGGEYCLFAPFQEDSMELQRHLYDCFFRLGALDHHPAPPGTGNFARARQCPVLWVRMSLPTSSRPQLRLLARAEHRKRWSVTKRDRGRHQLSCQATPLWRAGTRETHRTPTLSSPTVGTQRQRLSFFVVEI